MPVTPTFALFPNFFFRLHFLFILLLLFSIFFFLLSSNLIHKLSLGGFGSVKASPAVWGWAPHDVAKGKPFHPVTHRTVRGGIFGQRGTLAFGRPVRGLMLDGDWWITIGSSCGAVRCGASSTVRQFSLV